MTSWSLCATVVRARPAVPPASILYTKLSFLNSRYERDISLLGGNKTVISQKAKAFLYEKPMCSGLFWLPGCHNDHILYVCAVIVPTMLRTPENEAHPNRFTLKHLLPAVKCIAAALISFILWLLFCGVIKLLTFGIKLRNGNKNVLLCLANSQNLKEIIIKKNKWQIFTFKR